MCKCEFCGRDLILYKDNWICGHGCLKPAIKPKESTPPKQTKTNERNIEYCVKECFYTDTCSLLDYDKCHMSKKKEKNKKIS